MSMPVGDYAVTLENFTGQSWRIPNELQQCDPSWGCPSVFTVVDATQGVRLTVQ
jgi:hypothetical protein